MKTENVEAHTLVDSECIEGIVAFSLQISFNSHIFIQVLLTRYMYKSCSKFKIVDQRKIRVSYILGWREYHIRSEVKE
jgi:hypothetical protein